MMGKNHPKALQLQCAIQNYAWGKVGQESTVAQLVQSVCSHFNIDATQQYAELWMGTHPSGPAKIVGGAGLLKDWIHENQACLGSKVQAIFGPDLPFLFKVLSVNKALSIQAHPSKEHAEELHEKYPDKYPDANHKPEMAIALTPFEVLCGFRPFSEIQNFVREISELRETIGQQTADLFLQPTEDKASQRETLKKCFTSLMTCPQATFSNLLEDFVAGLLKDDKERSVPLQKMKDLVLRIYSQFPGDIGCFGLLFFNYIQLKPGESLYLAANEPHAYLYGDCIECMACSDNVVRAGLTPKFKDVETLCEMLTYITKGPADNLFQPTINPIDPFCTVYRPPVDDFAVDRILVPDSSSSYILAERDSASILLVIGGDAAAEEGIACKRGTVLFIPANQEISFQIKKTGDLLMFRAYSPL